MSRAEQLAKGWRLKMVWRERQVRRRRGKTMVFKKLTLVRSMFRPFRWPKNAPRGGRKWITVVCGPMVKPADVTPEVVADLAATVNRKGTS